MPYEEHRVVSTNFIIQEALSWEKCLEISGCLFGGTKTCLPLGTLRDALGAGKISKQSGRAYTWGLETRSGFNAQDVRIQASQRKVCGLPPSHLERLTVAFPLRPPWTGWKRLPLEAADLWSPWKQDSIQIELRFLLFGCFFSENYFRKHCIG